MNRSRTPPPAAAGRNARSRGAPSGTAREAAEATPAAPAVAPPMTSAIARGSQSVEYTTMHSSASSSITSIVPRCFRNIGAVISYWNRRCASSRSTICSGIGRPMPVVITRIVPSTLQSTMPGNQVWSWVGSPASAHTSAALRRMRIW